MTLSARSNVGQSFAAFASWLTKNPLDGDRVYGASSVRYQVARYCDYLDANPWANGDPLREPAARDGAMRAYGIYLHTFDTPTAAIRLILLGVEHFYLFLRLDSSTAPPRTTE
ncbi:MAG TPA: hypothetical protein VLC06_24095 [Polyangia bacterium]|jgi:hypothetical protein|nr:hypothetical protein [Polyangia bacterium]